MRRCVVSRGCRTKQSERLTEMEHTARTFDVEEGTEAEEFREDDVSDAVAGGVRDE